MDHDELDHLLVPRSDDIVDRKYRVRERLGTGGMGIVFRVEHVHTGRTYALKVLRPALAATPEGRRRFEAEARAIGALRHPNVVDVVDFGYAGTGSARFPYLVMEQLEGYPLSRTLVGGAGLPWPWVTSVVEQICRAVDGAHAAGIVHGDLKPENVWLTPRTTGGFDVKVLDFGLARAGASEATAVALSEAIPSIDDGDAHYFHALDDEPCGRTVVADERHCRDPCIHVARAATRRGPLSRCRRVQHWRAHLPCPHGCAAAARRDAIDRSRTPGCCKTRCARPRARRSDGRSFADPR